MYVCMWSGNFALCCLHSRTKAFKVPTMWSFADSIAEVRERTAIPYIVFESLLLNKLPPERNTCNFVHLTLVKESHMTAPD